MTWSLSRVLGPLVLAACTTPAPPLPVTPAQPALRPVPVTLFLPPALPVPSASAPALASASASAVETVAVTPVFPEATPGRTLLDPSLATVRAPPVFRARFTTSRGRFVIAVHRSWAPNGADRFYNLVRAGFYDGTRFFRVIDGFMVQWGISGDPAISAAWHDAHIQDDPHKRSNVRATVSFAKSGAPDSATTQVFVNYGDNARLDAMRFTPFGEVVEGMGALDALHKGYGEGEPGGKGPSQGRMEREGDRYLEGFPLLDRVLEARVEGE